MSKLDELETTIGQLCHLAFELIGRNRAQEMYLSALAHILVDENQELREKFKEKFLDLSELQRLNLRSEVEIQAFDKTVETLTDHFTLMKGGGFFEDE